MNKTRQIALHIAACLIFLALPIIFSPNYSMDLFKNLTNPQGQHEIYTYILILFFFYLHYYIFVPKLFFTDKYVTYTASVVFCFLVVYGVPKLFLIKHPPPHQHNEKRQPPHFTPSVFDKPEHYNNTYPPDKPLISKFKRPFWFEISQILAIFASVLFTSLAIAVNERRKKLEKEKLNAELLYLRAQVNPHFLFNTLNTIYALAIEKSDETAEAVTQLSSMMRYVLNETNKPFVSLEKEINYVSDYIELQKLRFGNTLQLKYIVSGKPNGRQIAPLILMSFIENAFKHGVNPENNSSILIEIDMLTDFIILTVGNKKVTTTGNLFSKSGLGIANTRTRLTSIYPTKHELMIADNENDYLICLKINLTND